MASCQQEKTVDAETHSGGLLLHGIDSYRKTCLQRVNAFISEFNNVMPQIMTSCCSTINRKVGRSMTLKYSFVFAVTVSLFNII